MSSAVDTPSSSANSSQSIAIDTLSIPELRDLHKKVDTEIQSLTSSRVQLQGVLNAFNASNTAITRLSQSQLGQLSGLTPVSTLYSVTGDEILLPLTGSLYVNGKVASTEKVIVDVGTGYFVERSVDDAVDYCKRKAVYLADNIRQVDQVLLKQQKALGSIGRVLEGKIVQEQQTSDTAGAS